MTVKEGYIPPMIEPLTSLRFIFVILVFFHHFIIADTGNSFFPEGYLGVTFFFILSGFIVSLNYEEKILHKKIRRTDFFIKRVIRLYPLHILCFFLAIVVLHNFLNRESFIWAIPNLLLLQSWIPIEDSYFSFNRVSWFLSSEIFFYAMFPVIIVFIHKIKKKSAFFLFLIIVIIYFLSTFIVPEKWFHPLYYIFPLSRIIDFIWGVFAYYVYKWIQNKKMITQFSKIGVSLIEVITLLVLVGFIIYSNHIPQVYRYGMYYWFPMLILVFVFACFHRKEGIISYILTNKILVLLGKASFGFYIIHLLMIRIISKIIAVSGISIAWYVTLILSVFVTIAFSILILKKFETPVSEYLNKKYVKFADK